MENNVCEICKYLTQNVEKIKSCPDLKYENETTESSIQNCYVCCSIFSKIESILKEIFSKSPEYEFDDFLITNSFSPLFAIIHKYSNGLLHQNKLLPDQYDIDVSYIRKLFKPIMLPSIKNYFSKEFNPKAKFTIQINFEFSEQFYNKIYSIFSFLPSIKKVGEKNFVPFSTKYDKGTINELLKNLSNEILTQLFEKHQLLENISESLFIKVDLLNDNVLMKAKYLKFSREIGQSAWMISGVKICESSVSEEINKALVDLADCKDIILHAGGREDRDVRMLGSGRPCILEFVNPKKAKTILNDFKKLEDALNNSTPLIRLIDLEPCDKSYFDEVKKFEDSKQKDYTCVVWSEKLITIEDIEKINSIRNLEIIQKTPLRVMHRRSLMDRKKQILALKAEPINEHFMIVHVTSSAGTYIKEFIHSDLGRTYPSLGTILETDCDILQLDVLNIQYENKNY